MAGALGGTISSTALTLQFSRLSRAEPHRARALALGVLAACTVLPLRIMAVSLVLNPRVAVAVLYYVVPALVAAGVPALLLLRGSISGEASPTAEPRNPLRLALALQMAVVFEIAIVLSSFARAMGVRI